MASLKTIKSKILSIKKTSTVTRAMEAVSAVKMRKTQERALSARLFAASALNILEKISATVDLARHPLMLPQEGKTAIVIVTSDKGLAGALNSSVIRAVENYIAEKNLSKKDLVIIGIGRRGAEYFATRGFDVRVRHENVSDGISESDVTESTQKIIEWHTQKEIGSAAIAYTNFISTFEQEAVVRELLPITPKMVKEMVEGIRPARGRYAPQKGVEDAAPKSYTIEPAADEVLDVLLPRLINIGIFHAIIEAKASEHSARMVAMKNATDNAKERAKEYTRYYNKVRQANITREISEITSGMEAMK